MSIVEGGEDEASVIAVSCWRPGGAPAVSSILQW